MGVLLTIIFLFVALVLLLLFVALFTKKDYSVNCEILIARPKQIVFDYVKYLKNQDDYSKWATMDKNMRRDYKGTDGEIGFISAWDSDNSNVGKGEQEITNFVGNEKVEYQVRFLKPFESVANTYFMLESINANQTKLTWGFKSRMPFPFNIVLLFMNFNKIIGKDFNFGLNNIKNILEKK